MARKSLTDNTDLPVKESDNVEGSIPFFIIENDYGIACDKYCYSLVKRRKANRTVKENNVPSHIESYTVWEDIAYVNSFQAVFEQYIKIKGLELSADTPITRDFNRILQNEKQIETIIKTAFSHDGKNKDFISFADLIDQKEALIQDIQELRKQKEDVQKAVEELLNLVKQKRSIVLKETEETKHRYKLEK